MPSGFALVNLSWTSGGRESRGEWWTAMRVGNEMEAKGMVKDERWR